MTLGQVKVGNNSENLLSEIRLFILCINEITKNVYSNTIKSVQI